MNNNTTNVHGNQGARQLPGSPLPYARAATQGWQGKLQKRAKFPSQIEMFCEHMANNCLLRFQPYWNINEPKENEEHRIIHISRFNCDETFTSAAAAVGVQLDEWLDCLQGLPFFNETP